MSLAFSSLVLFLLLLPGSIASRFYFTGPFSKEWFKPSLYDLVVAAIIPSLMLHSLALWFIHWRYGGIIDLSPFFLMIVGANSAPDVDKMTTWMGMHWQQLLSYNFILWVAAALGGILIKGIVRGRKWDRKYAFFRFRNEFYYLVSGEILDFPHVPGKASDIRFAKVSALVSVGKGSIIYQGILMHYTLSKDEKIDSLYLKQASREWLQEDANAATTGPLAEGENAGVDERGDFGESYPQLSTDIAGDWVVLPFAKIDNLSITYYTFEGTGGEPSSRKMRITKVWEKIKIRLKIWRQRWHKSTGELPVS